jgi:hypothetical protein
MDAQRLIASLDRFRRMLPEVVGDVSAEDARWKPPDGAWSILEVVCHLADEEEFDFGARLKLTLSDPNQPWPEIDPEGWARERRYNEGQLEKAVARFISLRERSLAWLRSLARPDWNRTYQHPKFGPFRAGDLLASWAAHDWLHLRQIAKRLYQIAGRDAGEYSTRYAGEWGA